MVQGPVQVQDRALALDRDHLRARPVLVLVQVQDLEEVGQKLAPLLVLLQDLELGLGQEGGEGEVVEVVAAVVVVVVEAVDVEEGLVMVQVREVDMVRVTEVAVIANK